MCGPFDVVVVFQVTEYGKAVRSAPSALPSSSNCTPTTPTSSEAVAVTAIDPDTVAWSGGAVIVTVGGVVSASTMTAASFDGPLTFPATSCAVTR